MSTGSHGEMKEFQRMLDARIARAHARMQQLEARAHEKKMQPEIAALEAARNLMRHIDQKRHSLEQASGHRMEEVQHEIEAANAKLDASIEQLTSRLQAESRGEMLGKGPSESHPKQHAKPHLKPNRPSDKPH